MRSHVSKLYQINLVLSENRLGYPREPSLVGISLAQSKIVFVTTVTFEGNGGKDCDPRSQLKIVFCATATAQETVNFVSAVTSGATAIQDLGQRLNFVTTVTIEETFENTGDGDSRAHTVKACLCDHCHN